MPPGRYTQKRRTQLHVGADHRTDELARFLGRSLLDARESRNVTQRTAAARAGLSQTAWSRLERGGGSQMSLRVWMRASWAVDADLHAYLEGVSAASPPRDSVHLRVQELIARTAQRGGWRAVPELHTAGAGFADLALHRGNELAMTEVWTWLADVGASFRSWDRKLESLQGQAVTASGCWILRSTRRNRDLVADHATLFAARFQGSATAWMAALNSHDSPMPRDPALLWVNVAGDRLFASRLSRSRR
jgi:transcriptional regulator with XRE-family HTH domain